MESALCLATEAIAELAALDSRCRELICKESLDGYNSTWRATERLLQNGATERVENPELTAAEFQKRLGFQSLEVTGPELLTFWYGDDNMFCGHWLSLSSFDGVALGDTYVTLQG